MWCAVTLRTMTSSLLAVIIGMTLLMRVASQEMSESCLNKYCDLISTYASCPALVGDAVAMDMVCAKYFLGAIKSCPNFPPADKTYDAPSVCVNQISLFLGSVVGGALPGPFDIIQNPGVTQMDMCKDECYDSYLFYASDFFASCEAELVYVENVQPLEPWQAFRGQACTSTASRYEDYSINCFDQNRALAANGDGTVAALLADTGCMGLASQGVDEAAALAEVCQKFSAFQCCAANEFTLFVQQATVFLPNNTDVKFMPPCLANYLTDSCPTVQLNLFCSDGVVADVNTARFRVTITGLDAVGASIPNLYDTNETNEFMGLLAAATMGDQTNPATSYQNHPVVLPFAQLATIYNFTYLNASGAATTPPVPSLTKDDYTTATGMDVWYQMTLGGQGSEVNLQAIAEQYMALYVVQGLTCPTCAVTVQAGETTYTPVDPGWNVKGSPNYSSGSGDGGDGDGLSRENFTILVGSCIAFLLFIPALKKLAK